MSAPPILAVPESVRKTLEEVSNPAYVCTMDLRFVLYNAAILQIVGLSEKDAQCILGKSWIDVLFDWELGVRKLFLPEQWESAAIQQLVKVRQVANSSLGTKWLRSIEKEMGKYDEFDLLWKVSKSRVKDFPIAERGQLTFAREGFVANFTVASYRLSGGSYYLIEYYPSDALTAGILKSLTETCSNNLTVFAVAELLRSIHSFKKLSSSPLLTLEIVKRRAELKQISLTQSIASIMDEVIESIRPRLEMDHRTRLVIRYEILRMMAYEGATEEQMMWDLGFDTDFDPWLKNNEEKSREPRYPYLGMGVYAATSRASFKRLKSQAIEDVRWRLEELERRMGGDLIPN